MREFILKSVATGTVVAFLTGCGGGTGGGLANYASQFANLSAMDIMTFTPEPNLPTGSATYLGVASFNIGSTPTSLSGYYGALDVDVNFAADTLSGSVTNFSDFTRSPVSGSIAITSGVLTGANTASIGGGLNASAAGTVDGRSLAFDVTGHFFSPTGEGVALYFDQIGALGGGTGFAAR